MISGPGQSAEVMPLAPSCAEAMVLGILAELEAGTAGILPAF